jgi:hypothetical protein
VGLTKNLDLTGLQKTGLAFSAEEWHPGIKRFTTELPSLVDTLAQEGSPEGIFPAHMVQSYARARHGVDLSLAQCLDWNGRYSTRNPFAALAI